MYKFTIVLVVTKIISPIPHTTNKVSEVTWESISGEIEPVLMKIYKKNDVITKLEARVTPENFWENDLI